MANGKGAAAGGGGGGILRPNRVSIAANVGQDLQQSRNFREARVTDANLTARGAMVTLSTGERIRLSQPQLDRIGDAFTAERVAVLELPNIGRNAQGRRVSGFRQILDTENARRVITGLPVQ